MAEPIVYFDAAGVAQYVSAATPLPTVGAPLTATNSSVKLEDNPHSSGEVGTFILAVRNDNATANFTDNNGDYSPVAVGASGAVFMRPEPSRAATVSIRTMVAVTAQTLQSANASRRSLEIFNDTTAPLNVRLGAGASATSFTTRLAIGGYYKVPDEYVGLVEGFATGTGAGPVLVTEVV